MIPNRPASDVGWLNGPGAGMGEMYDTDGLEPTLDSGRLGSDDKISHASELYIYKYMINVWSRAHNIGGNTGQMAMSRLWREKTNIDE